MKGAAAVLAGGGLGLCGALLAGAFASAFWPLVALELQRMALVAGGVAALAASVAPTAWRERLRRRRALLALAGCAGLGAVALALGPLARGLQPGAGLRLLAFPVPFLLALAVPAAAAGVAVATWCGEPAGRRPAGLFLAGIGAGALGAALLAGTLGSPLLARAGGRWLEVLEVGGRSREVSLDRGLRRFLAAPRGAQLAFPPGAGEGQREILVVGLANGPVLARLLAAPAARITVLEPDAALARAVSERWPALARAVAAGRVEIRGGAERWALARLRGDYDLIVVGENWSPAAYHARALGHRRDHRWTTEAFAAYLARLKPQGRLLAQRTGIGRVVATLRAAAGLPAAEFGRRLVVLGGGGRIVSECWYSPAGLDSPADQARLRRHRKRTGVQLLYDPVDRRGRNFYTPLVRGDRAPGLAFSTPLDLSPALDRRPFFDNAERLLLSPRGRALPEELEPLEAPSTLRILPAADRALWGILLGGLTLAAAALSRVRDAPARHVLPGALWCGAAAGLILEAFTAWSGYVAPAAAADAAARSALLAGLGAGLALGRGPGGIRRRCVPAAVLVLLFGAAGYRALPALLRLGPAAGSAALVGAGALLGAALGVALGAGLDRAEALAAGGGGVFGGTCLAAAALAGLAATLAATHFGYPLLWVLAGVALLASALRRASPVAVVAGTAT